MLKFTILAYFISINLSFAVLENWIVLIVFLVLYHLHKEPQVLVWKHKSRLFKFSSYLLACLILIFGSLNYYGSIFIANNFNKAFYSPYVSLRELSNTGRVSIFYPEPLQKNMRLHYLLLGNSSLVEDHYQSLVERSSFLSSNNLQSILLKARINQDTQEIDRLIQQAYLLGPNLPIVSVEAYNIYAALDLCDKALIHKNKLLKLTPKRYYDHKSNCENVTECRIFLKHASLFEDVINDQRCV